MKHQYTMKKKHYLDYTDKNLKIKISITTENTAIL